MPFFMFMKQTYIIIYNFSGWFLYFFNCRVHVPLLNHFGLSLVLLISASSWIFCLFVLSIRFLKYLDKFLFRGRLFLCLWQCRYCIHFSIIYLCYYFLCIFWWKVWVLSFIFLLVESMNSMISVLNYCRLSFSSHWVISYSIDLFFFKLFPQYYFIICRFYDKILSCEVLCSFIINK